MVDLFGNKKKEIKFNHNTDDVTKAIPGVDLHKFAATFGRLTLDFEGTAGGPRKSHMVEYLMNNADNPSVMLAVAQLAIFGVPLSQVYFFSKLEQHEELDAHEVNELEQVRDNMVKTQAQLEEEIERVKGIIHTCEKVIKDKS